MALLDGLRTFDDQVTDELSHCFRNDQEIGPCTVAASFGALPITSTTSTTSTSSTPTPIDWQLAPASTSCTTFCNNQGLQCNQEAQTAGNTNLTTVAAVAAAANVSCDFIFQSTLSFNPDPFFNFDACYRGPGSPGCDRVSPAETVQRFCCCNADGCTISS